MSDLFTVENLSQYSHVDGLKFMAPIGDFTATHLGHLRDYETYVRIPLLTDAARSVNAIDVGANIGLLALPMAKVISGHLYAFDMSERNARLLMLNAERNDLKNVTVFPLAVGDQIGSQLTRLSSHTTLNTMLRKSPMEDILSNDVRIIPTVTLDSFFAGGPDIDLLKIDVDGWDLQVLRGSVRTISRNRPVIYTEYSPKHIREATGANEAEFLEILLQQGYRPEVLGPNVPYSTPKKSSLEELQVELRTILDAVPNKEQTHIDLRWTIESLHLPASRTT